MGKGKRLREQRRREQGAAFSGTVEDIVRNLPTPEESWQAIEEYRRTHGGQLPPQGNLCMTCNLRFFDPDSCYDCEHDVANAEGHVQGKPDPQKEV